MNEIKQKVRTLEQMTGMQQLNDFQLNQYIRHKTAETPQTLNEYQQNQDAVLAQKLIDMMLIDTAGAAELEELLPELREQKNAELARLQADSAGSDKKKRDAANKKLSMLAKRRRMAEIRRSNLGNTEPAAYRPAQQREMERGRHWANPLRAAMNSQALGSHADRHENAEYRHIGGTTQESVTIHTPNGILRGQIYQPRNVPPTGKLIIVFSGSGSSGASQIESIVSSYAGAGAAVLHAEYRGFGASETWKNNRKCGTHLCEDSLYQDGKDILNYALSLKKPDNLNEAMYKPSDIVLHGFSLGGAVASKIAADYSEQNAQKLARGETVTEEDRLGGIVLNSAIATMQEAADDAAPQWLRGISGVAAMAGAGSYDTRSHMRRLFQYDPNLPVHYRSGSLTSEDHLGLDATELHLDTQAAFKNASHHIGAGDHMDTNMLFNNHAIKELATKGRSANLSPQS